MIRKLASLALSVCLLLTLAFPALATEAENGAQAQPVTQSEDIAEDIETADGNEAPGALPDASPDEAAAQAFLRVKGFGGTHIKVSTLDGMVLAESKGAQEATATLVPNQPYLVSWTISDGVGYKILYDGVMEPGNSNNQLVTRVPSGKTASITLVADRPGGREPHYIGVTVQPEIAAAASASMESAYEGDSIQITLLPTSGFTFKGWKPYPEDVVIADDGSFIMPDAHVSILAEFEIDEAADDDLDGVPDYVEAIFGSDPTLKDTDGDGLSDYQEIYVVQTDPTLPDTDGNGVLDGAEDPDEDGLSSLQEFALGTDPVYRDSDGDGLSDGEEVNVQNTDPLKADTDGDKLPDALELKYHMDPLNRDTLGDGILDGDRSFTTTVECADSEPEDAVTVSADVTLSGDKLESLNIEKVSDTDTFLSNEIPGYLGNAFEFQADGGIDGATLRFTFDPALLEDPEFTPAVYYWNEEAQLLQELPNQTVSNNTVSVTVEHFSRYILLNKTVYDKVWAYELQWDDGSLPTYKYIDIAFVIDSSGSMTSNDAENVRISVTKDFIDRLNADDRAAIIDFDSYATVLADFTTDKDVLKAAADRIDSSGGTNLTEGISSALDQFRTTGGSRPNALKYIIMLTDGQGTYDTRLTSQAAQAGIVIHTIGLGDGISTAVLNDIAAGTGGQYYPASEAEQLYDIFDNIADTSDLHKDTDNDGVKDYYEKEMAAGHLRLGSGVPLAGMDYQLADSDRDGLKDGQELTVTRLGNRIFVKMTSNPTLPDSDFDGSEDKADTQPLNNVFNFKYKNSDYSVNSDVSFTMDYRLLFRDNTKYSSTLSRTSSMLAAGMYSFGTLNGNHTNVLLSQFGMKDVVNDVVGLSTSDNHECGYALGYREVAYQGQDKIIVAVMVRGTSSAAEWSSNFNVGSASFDRPAEWRNTSNHMGFDIAANRIYDNINKYITSRDFPADQIVYWVAGHSRGAGVANILSARLADEGKKIFAYTYATPNTTTTANANTAAKYDCIFNVVNTDDLVPQMPLENWKFKRYGRTAERSVTELYKQEWEALSGTGEEYKHANINDVIAALEGIAGNRDECYTLTCSHGSHDGQRGSIASSGDYTDNSITHIFRTSSAAGQKNFIDSIPADMIPYCGLISRRDDAGPIDNYVVDVCQTPAYFMQHLAMASSANGLLSKIGVIINYNMALRYEHAKRVMVNASVSNGGVALPHLPISYYLLSKHVAAWSF